MPKYAEVRDGIVQNIISSDPGYALANNLIYADGVSISIGYAYSEEEGFRPPKPYESWTWQYCEDCGGIYKWAAPVPFPADGKLGILGDSDGVLYNWDESTLSWTISE